MKIIFITLYMVTTSLHVPYTRNQTSASGGSIWISIGVHR